jgi:hypothetical protein
MRKVGLVGLVLGGALFAFACSGGRDGFVPDTSATDPASSSGAPGTFKGDAGAGGVPAHACVPDPANYDFPGNNCDDDGDGTIDNPPTCDGALPRVGSAEEFARAIGLCAKASDKGGWGLVSAKYTRGFGRDDEPMADQHGVLPKFGDVVKPREGKALGVLSNGYAREFDGDNNEAFGPFPPGGKGGGKDWFNYGNPGSGKAGTGTLPPGFPKQATGCGDAALESVANDVINVKLEIKAPKNASGLRFDFNFFSSEWPVFICSPYNDGFLAYLSAKSFNGGKADNISFDATKSPISVNNGFFDRCTPNVKTGCDPFGQAKPGVSKCPGGPAELAGTGYGVVGSYCGSAFDPGSPSTNGGATGWLTSKAPIQAGETFTLELMIWDTGDGKLDSSVLVDNFGWAEGAVITETERPK